jgi:hypothetical protein
MNKQMVITKYMFLIVPSFQSQKTEYSLVILAAVIMLSLKRGDIILK